MMHVPDCPMTNTDPAARTGCVCEHWTDVERNTPEGSGGVTRSWSDYKDNSAQEEADRRADAGDYTRREMRLMAERDAALSRAEVAEGKVDELEHVIAELRAHRELLAHVGKLRGGE